MNSSPMISVKGELSQRIEKEKKENVDREIHCCDHNIIIDKFLKKNLKGKFSVLRYFKELLPIMRIV